MSWWYVCEILCCSSMYISSLYGIFVPVKLKKDIHWQHTKCSSVTHTCLHGNRTQRLLPSSPLTASAVGNDLIQFKFPRFHLEEQNGHWVERDVIGANCANLSLWAASETGDRAEGTCVFWVHFKRPSCVAPPGDCLCPSVGFSRLCSRPPVQTRVFQLRNN